MTQPMIIKEHLKTYGHISGKEAFEKYGIYRLSEVIRKLRHKGCRMETVMKNTDTIYGNVDYGDYVWKGEADEQ